MAEIHDGDRTPTEEIADTLQSSSIDLDVELSPSYSYSLKHRIVENCVMSAILEPQGSETIVAVSVSNKVIIKDTETSLHIPETIRCITSAPFGPGYDYIVIGTDAHVICYDVHNNQTIFRAEVPDGVNCFAVGRISDMQEAIFCGGNCCIWGFDRDGTNIYWTVTGDVVRAMCICDYDSDGEPELIVGSPDFEIRIFKNDLMRAELMETDAVVFLEAVSNNCFGYALDNGTIGVYRKEERLWRIKSKNNVSTIFQFPNENLMTCVWKMGKVDIRLVENGDVVSKDQSLSGHVVAATMCAKENGVISVVCSDGMVQEYRLRKRDESADKTQDLIREFGQKKHNLMIELANYEQEEQMSDAEKERDHRIPIDTSVGGNYVVDSEAYTLNFLLEASHNIFIRAVVIFAEGMFEGESYIWVPPIDKQGDKVTMPIVPEKDAQNDMHIKAFLGHVDSTKLHLFEMSRLVPRFARFALIPDIPEFPPASSYVEFEIKQRPQRIFEWIHDNFTVDQNSAKFDEEDLTIELRFLGLAPKKEQNLYIKLDRKDNKMFIHNECIETVGNLVQSIGEYFQLNFLESRAIFPHILKEAEDILNEIDPMTEVRDRLTAELQERQSVVKEMMIRAEDAIAIDNMVEGRKYYVRLKQMDATARQASQLRWNNNERCVKSLRRLNKIIENAAKLRIGDAGRQIVTSCRSAISEDNKQIIPKILEFGAS